MFITEEWLQHHLNTKQIGGIVKNNSAHIICENGARISVQAGSNWYSTPRDDFGPYTHVEYCFVANTIDTVYGYVPIKKVVDLINEFGGVAEILENNLNV